MSDNKEKVIHTIEPVWNEDSTILILGSFPSIKSRECNFFYGHPQNRFWKVLACLFGKAVPSSIDEKKSFLLENHVAVWDVIYSCLISGSQDSSIEDVVPNDIKPILQNSKISKIYTNGKTAYKLYMKYIYPSVQIEPILLPSTSPANAKNKLEDLVCEWSKIIDIKN